MSELLQREDLVKDRELVRSLYDLNFRRTGIRSRDAGKLVDDFLTEYRGIQSNTIKMFEFMNFATSLDEKDPEDKKIKDSLAYAYNTIDQRTEGFLFDDSIDFGDKVSALGDYVMYGALDPINFLGFGAGKAVTAAASRPLIRTFVQKSLGKEVVETPVKQSVARRLGEGAAAGAVAESAVAFPSELVLQETEKTLGDSVREKTSIAEAAINTLPSAILGGALGAVGAGLRVKSIPKSDEFVESAQPFKVKTKTQADEIIEEAERAVENSPQGTAATRQTLKESFEKDGPETVNYIYVAKKDADFENLDNIGRVENVRDGIATVKYRVKNPDTQITEFKFEKIDLDDLKAASSKKTIEYVKYAQRDLRTSLDPDMVEEGRQVLRDLYNDDEDVVERFRFNEVDTKNIQDVFNDIIKEDPEILSDIDPTNRITQIFSEVVAKVSREDLVEKVGDGFTKYNVDPDKFAKLIMLDAHNNGVGLSNASRLGRQFNDQDLAELIRIGLQNTISLDRDPRNKILAEALKDYKETTSNFGLISKVVDLWRGMIVSQPETTMRNIVGLAFQFPGQSVENVIDDVLYNVQSKALGFEIDPNQPVIKKDAFDFVKRNLNAKDSIKLTRYLSGFKEFNELDDAFFKGFDIFTESFEDSISEGLKNSRSYRTVKAAGKVVDAVNVLNRAVDRSVKSSAFISHMNNEVIDAINRGIIKVDVGADGKPKIKDFMDIIRQNRFDLINDSMVTNSIDFAFRVSYQAKVPDITKEMRGRGIKSLDAPGAVFAEVIDGLDRLAQLAGPVGKIVVPFQRFLFNMQFHMLNRTVLLPFNVTRDIYRGYSLAKGKRGRMSVEQRKIFNQVEDEIRSLSKDFRVAKGNKRTAIREELRVKNVLYAELEKELGLNELDYFKMKQTIRQTADTAALLSSAYALREVYGSDQGWSIFEDDEGNTYDLRTWFPFAQYLYMAEFARRYLNAKEGDTIPLADLGRDVPDIIFGANIRTGPLNFFSSNLQKMFTQDPDAGVRAERVGTFLGESLGNFLNGFITPLRAIDEAFVNTNILSTVGIGQFKNREEYKDARLNYLFDEGFFSPTYDAGEGFVEDILANTLRGFFNGSVNMALRGPFSRIVFDEKPSFSITTGEVRRSEMPRIIEQLSGLGIGEKTNPAIQAMVQANLDPYATIMSGKYSGIPKHDAIYRQVIGNLIAENLVPIVSDPKFLALKMSERKRIIQDQLAVLKKESTQRIKNEAPLLARLARFKKSKKSSRNTAIRRYTQEFGIKPNFNYINEDNIEQSQMLDYLERFAKARPPLVSTQMGVPRSVKGTASLREAIKAVTK